MPEEIINYVQLKSSVQCEYEKQTTKLRNRYSSFKLKIPIAKKGEVLNAACWLDGKF